MLRTGKQYIEGLKDGRKVYMNGECISDVANHPAFTGIIKSFAKLYDISSDESNDMTFTTEDGTKANKIYMIPRSVEDLAERRKAITKWAEATCGFAGRSPDHVASFFAAFASRPDVFARGGEQFKDNLERFYKKVRDEDLFVTYVIIPPQIDRSKAAHELDQKFIPMGVYEERKDGIVIRGSQMLGTSTAVSDWVFCTCITPLRPGDEDYAISFAIPVNAPGLKLYPRQPFAVDKASTFDYPLSTQFDESDSFCVFDDVFVPWEQVFVYKNIEVTRAQFFETGAHILGNSQSQNRFTTKLKFLIGVARKIAELNGTDKFPQVQEKLGEIASTAATVEGLTLAAEYTATIKEGTAIPNPRFLYALVGMQENLYSKIVAVIRELSGGGVLQGPATYKEFLNPDTADDIQRYIRSGVASSEEKVKLFKLAWDIIGTEFGGRHQQYEMFYNGAPYVVKGYSFRNYGYEEPLAMVNKFLDSYGLPKQ